MVKQINSINMFHGCMNNCGYCCAHAISAWHKLHPNGVWSNMILNKGGAVKASRSDGNITCPSTHDIFPENLETMIATFKTILERCNDLVIPSKPRFQCIQAICRELHDYKDQVTFNFTFSSSRDEILGIWEPGAPSFKERYTCLNYAYGSGYRTSVSVEPMLDSVDDTIKMVDNVRRFVSNKIFIGLPKMFPTRLSINGFFYQDAIQEELERLKVIHSDKEIIRLVYILQHYPEVIFNDTIWQTITNSSVLATAI